MEFTNWFLYETWWGIITFSLALICLLILFPAALFAILYYALRKKPDARHQQ